MSYIIVGLGNPGEEYTHTRHNTGRMMLEHIAKKFDFASFKEKISAKALVSEGKIDKEKVLLVEPNNFMNRSGGSVAPFVTSEKKAHSLIVMYDDLDLPLGSIRISYNRSAGGHKGLDSIIKALKTQEFIRIRVGISPVTPQGKLKKPQGDEAVTKHIIGNYKPAESEILKKVAKKVAEAVECVIKGGYEKAMGEYNTAI